MTTVGLLEGSTEALYDNEAELRRLIGERLILLGAAAEPGQSEALADIILGRIAREAGRLVKAAEPEAADSAKTAQTGCDCGRRGRHGAAAPSSVRALGLAGSHS